MRIQHLKWTALAGGLLTLAALTPTVAGPLPVSGTVLKSATASDVTDVRWRGRYGWGVGAFGAGVAIGALAARPYYYDYGPPAGYYGPPPVVYDPPAPVYSAPIDPNGPVRQCWVPTDRDRGFGYYRPC